MLHQTPITSCVQSTAVPTTIKRPTDFWTCMINEDCVCLSECVAQVKGVRVSKPQHVNSYRLFLVDQGNISDLYLWQN